MLGYGFLEKVYVNALTHELVLRGHNVVRNVRVRVTYKGVVAGNGLIDMLVDDKLILETKSTQELHPSAARQLRNYLRASSLDIGLILHFGPKPKVQRVEIFRSHGPAETSDR